MPLHLEDKDPAKSEPKIGPVHEKETMDSVSAIKKTPKIPPTPSPLLVKISPLGRQRQVRNTQKMKRQKL